MDGDKNTRRRKPPRMRGMAWECADRRTSREPFRWRLKVSPVWKGGGQPRFKCLYTEPRSAGWMTSPARMSQNRRYALCLAPASRALTLRANPCGFGYPPLPHSCAVRPLRGRRALCVHAHRKFLTSLFRFSHHSPRNHAGWRSAIGALWDGSVMRARSKTRGGSHESCVPVQVQPPRHAFPHQPRARSAR